MEHEKKEVSSKNTSILSPKRLNDNQISGGSASKVATLAKVPPIQENESSTVLGKDSDTQEEPTDQSPPSGPSKQAPAPALTLSEEEDCVTTSWTPQQEPGPSGAANLPEQKSESHPTETSKNELKDDPDLPDYTSSSSTDSSGDEMETENCGADNTNWPTCEMLDDFRTWDLDDIRQNPANLTSGLCQGIQTERITDAVGGSESVIPIPSPADCDLGDEASMELGTDSDTQVTPEPMDCSPPWSPLRTGQAHEMAPGLTGNLNDGRKQPAYTLGNASQSQDTGPSRGYRKRGAHYNGITSKKPKVSVQVKVKIRTGKRSRRHQQ